MKKKLNNRRQSFDIHASAFVEPLPPEAFHVMTRLICAKMAEFIKPTGEPLTVDDTEAVRNLAEAIVILKEAT